MTRNDLEKLATLDLDLESIGLLDLGGELTPYFCTPVGAELVGRLGVDGIHFVLLPGDQRVFCVDPAMGDVGTYVLPVAEDLRQFLSFLLFCKDASALSQIYWLSEERFRQLLAEGEQTSWPGSDAFFARREQALTAIAEEFHLSPADPYGPVRAMQEKFDPSMIEFSDEYYDVLGLEQN